MTDRTFGVEILIGRAAASCAHPIAAWRAGSVAVRAWLLVAYFCGSFLAVLGALELGLSPLT